MYGLLHHYAERSMHIDYSLFEQPSRLQYAPLNAHESQTSLQISLHLAISIPIHLAFLLRPKLRQLAFDPLIQPGFELWPIPARKQRLKPYEEWGQEKCLDQVVQQRWCPAFKDSMADELSDPRREINGKSDVVCHGAVCRCGVITECRPSHDQRCYHQACNWFHEDVERGVGRRGCSAKIEWQVRDGQPFRCWQVWRVGSLERYQYRALSLQPCLDGQAVVMLSILPAQRPCALRR